MVTKKRMVTKKICSSCAAEYDDTLPKCPYCGTLNYKGAEAEYFEKLEDVRSDMEELEEVPIHETKRELARQGAFVKKVLLFFGGIVLVLAALTVYMNRDMKMDAKAEYRWKQEVFPILDGLYEEGNFEELLDTYWEVAADDMPLWDWEHADFCDVLDQCLYLEDILDKEADGESLTELEYTYLLYYGFRLTKEMDDELSVDEVENLETYVERISADFQNRWEFTEIELEAITREREKNYGNVSFEFCEDYVGTWLKAGK